MTTIELYNREWLEHVDALIHSWMSDPTLSAEQLAQLLYMSRSQLYRKLIVLRGVTPKAYIQEKRLKHARLLLELGEIQSVKAVAFAVGMRKVRYFSAQFKVRYGLLPSSFLNGEANDMRA